MKIKLIADIIVDGNILKIANKIVEVKKETQRYYFFDYEEKELKILKKLTRKIIKN